MSDAVKNQLLKSHLRAFGAPTPIGETRHFWQDVCDEAATTIERLERELAETRTDGAAYHLAMSLLRSMKMEHGLCEPRSRRACTHCNASDDLAAMVMTYRGPRVVLSEEDWQ